MLATKDGERIGVEVETGKSDVLANVGNCLLAKFAMTVIVTTDENALRHVERMLGKAGLILPQRITLALQNKVMWGDFNTLKESTWIR